jgi:protein-disulfide isomerase
VVTPRPQQTPTKSRVPFIVGLLVVLAAGVGVVVYKMRSSDPPSITLAPNTPMPKAEGYLEGKADAPITLIEFADFECPGCGQFATVTEPLLRKHYIDSGTVNLRYFDFPLPMHANTMSASLAAACAADQGKFWEMHDLLFENQENWNTQATTNPKKVFDGLVTKIGVDAAAFNKCFSAQTDLARIEANRSAGIARNVPGTPTMIIGDQLFFPAPDFPKLKIIIDSLLKVKSSAPAPAPAKP